MNHEITLATVRQGLVNQNREIAKTDYAERLFLHIGITWLKVIWIATKDSRRVKRKF